MLDRFGFGLSVNPAAKNVFFSVGLALSGRLRYDHRDDLFFNCWSR
jgi:hypothetical protein